MKASIVIPAHNEQEFIGRTIKNALVQDFGEEFEVIVVDNASDDKTFDEASRFPNVRVLREEKKGVQFAREAGRKEARGEILAYLDADSTPPKDWLKKGVACFSDENVVGVSGPYDYYDAGPIFKLFSFIHQKITYRFIHFLVQNVFKKGAVMNGGNTFVRASAMEKINGFNTAIKFYGDDADAGHRLTRVGKVLYKTDIYVGNSARRMRGLKVIKTPAIYALNFIWILLFDRPYSQ